MALYAGVARCSSEIRLAKRLSRRHLRLRWTHAALVGRHARAAIGPPDQLQSRGDQSCDTQRGRSNLLSLCLDIGLALSGAEKTGPRTVTGSSLQSRKLAPSRVLISLQVLSHDLYMSQRFHDRVFRELAAYETYQVGAVMYSSHSDDAVSGCPSRHQGRFSRDHAC
jgi:hypothetical protein